MKLPIRIRKSAGVPVTPAVHRLIDLGNRARGSSDWDLAASRYREAVALDPSLFHIWIQLGHALKEAGRDAEAEAAYRQAGDVAPHSPEPHLHLGHLAKTRGDMGAAGQHYMAAVKLDPSHADSVTELHRLVVRTTGFDREAMLDVLRDGWKKGDAASMAPLDSRVADLRHGLDLLLAELRDSVTDFDRDHLGTLTMASAALGDIGAEIVEAAARSGSEGGPAFVFDVSDLIGYYSHARLPTGIQRVQIEAISHALGVAGVQTRICCFINGREDWLEVPPDEFLSITQLSLVNGSREDKEWTTALSRLHIQLALAAPFAFPVGAYLVNLGTSWWMQNYFLFVREAKAKFGIRYIPFVHDFIPIITPEHCVKGLVQDFISWAAGVFDHADHFLVNSEATKRDLLMIAGKLGHDDVTADDVDVVRLNADFRKPGTRLLPRTALGRWGFEDEPYVLFVSTVESRKNHVGAFDAWLELIRRYGARRVPRLVCVGKRGWLNDPVYQRLHTSEALQSRVTMMEHLSDDELALLYRHCLFTLYPSNYEGWGLPITESLCYGKVPVVSDVASLPEAAGKFGVYFEGGSAVRLADAVEKVAYDGEFRKEREALIARDFKPRTWGDIAREINGYVLAQSERTDNRPARSGPPVIRLGAFYPVSRNEETRIWRGSGSGEIFRTGLNWNWPDFWGCWTRPAGGTLTIGLPEVRGPVRVYLWLRGVPGRGSDFRVDLGSRSVSRGSLAPDERRWVWFDVDPADPDGDPASLHLRLAGSQPEEVELNVGGVVQPNRITIALQGFYICETADVAGRAAFLEAAALGRLDELNAYRNPNEFVDFTDDFIGIEEWAEMKREAAE